MSIQDITSKVKNTVTISLAFLAATSLGSCGKPLVSVGCDGIPRKTHEGKMKDARMSAKHGKAFKWGGPKKSPSKKAIKRMTASPVFKK